MPRFDYDGWECGGSVETTGDDGIVWFTQLERRALLGTDAHYLNVRIPPLPQFPPD